MNFIKIIEDSDAEIIINDSIVELVRLVMLENWIPTIWIWKKLLSMPVVYWWKTTRNGNEENELSKKLQNNMIVFVLNSAKNAFGVSFDNNGADE